MIVKTTNNLFGFLYAYLKYKIYYYDNYTNNIHYQ